MQEKVIRIISIDPGKATGIASAVYTLTPESIGIQLEDTLFVEAGDYKNAGTLERHMYQAVENVDKLLDFIYVSCKQTETIWLAIESPFALLRNLNGVLTQQGYISAIAMRIMNLEPLISLSRFMLIKPAMVKKLATSNDTHPLTSGNGLSEKHHVAQAIADKFNLSQDELKNLTTKPDSRSKKAVYEVTDALAIGFSCARILQAAWFGLDQDLPVRKDTKSLRKKISEWRQA
jgi:hypothetical protein